MHKFLATLGLLAVLTAGCDAADTSAGADEGGDSTGLADRITSPVGSGQVHLVRMVQRLDRYSFDPDTLSISAGDVVRFVNTGSQPESVAFDAGAGASEIGTYLRANQLNRGVLLTEPGQPYDVSFDGAPAGEYPFHSVPHVGQGMRGAVIVAE